MASVKVSITKERPKEIHLGESYAVIRPLRCYSYEFCARRKNNKMPTANVNFYGTMGIRLLNAQARAVCCTFSLFCGMTMLIVM
ncbi:hypothetical protein NPIL_216731 [Nephila pilipes]|uniref:Uncharacterized protein n=1 Tax=Nephila pilipes TaxID=299642 RepID=A0A8X6TQ38_NEPPI|nr:hypothetical protein NPIL_216731 [Nephila pilipes]